MRYRDYLHYLGFYPRDVLNTHYFASYDRRQFSHFPLLWKRYDTPDMNVTVTIHKELYYITVTLLE